MMSRVDWIERVDITLPTRDYDILVDNGSITHE